MDVSAPTISAQQGRSRGPENGDARRGHACIPFFSQDWNETITEQGLSVALVTRAWPSSITVHRMTCELPLTSSPVACTRDQIPSQYPGSVECAGEDLRTPRDRDSGSAQSVHPVGHALTLLGQD